MLSCVFFFYALQGGCNFEVCEWNSSVWPFSWKLLSSVFSSDTVYNAVQVYSMKPLCLTVFIFQYAFFLNLVGFKLDPGKYSTFLAKTLTSAELAPVRLFKRVCWTQSYRYFISCTNKCFIAQNSNLWPSFSFTRSQQHQRKTCSRLAWS